MLFLLNVHNVEQEPLPSTLCERDLALHLTTSKSHSSYVAATSIKTTGSIFRSIIVDFNAGQRKKLGLAMAKKGWPVDVD